MNENSAVAIVKCPDYTPSEVFKAVKQAVDLLGGMQKFVRPGQKVLLKPNLLSASPPESAICTHPAVVEAVAGLAAAAGGTCFIGDSPSIGGQNSAGFRHLLQVTGFDEAAKRTGALVQRFDEAASLRSIPEARIFPRMLLADALESADVIINIPKFKTHGLTRLTGAVKNLFGCVPGRRKIELHLEAGNDPERFAQMVVDVARAVRPALSVMDAIVGMDGQGPAAGRRRNFGLVLASTDMVALDAAICTAAGISPMSVPMLRLAAEQGIGKADLDEIEVLGVRLEDVRISDFSIPPGGDGLTRMPKPLRRMLRNQLVRIPVILQEKCTACSTCAQACPTNAIAGKGKPPRLDYSVCIRCYCCQEVCPENAIELRAKLIRRALDTTLDMARRVHFLVRREG